MSLGYALVWIELLTGFAIALQCLEHFQLRKISGIKYFSIARLQFAIFLMLLSTFSIMHEFIVPGSIAGTASTSLALIDLSLLLMTILLIQKFRGPFNGGSDNMTLLILFCVGVSRLPLSPKIAEALIAYLALQVVLSYFIAGVVKVRNRQWWNGELMTWLLRDSVYNVPTAFRKLAANPRSLKAIGRATLVFELLFPISLISPVTLYLALGAAVLFHFGVALVLGLNRFLWIWMAAFPAVIWFQARWIG